MEEDDIKTLLKLIDAMTTGFPIAVFDEFTKPLECWILIQEIKIQPNGNAYIIDHQNKSWTIGHPHRWRFLSVNAFNNLSK